MAFAEGEISHFGYNAADGDYGHVVITKHILDGVPIWALYGHLDSASIEGKSVGQKVNAGEVICWMVPTMKMVVGSLTYIFNYHIKNRKLTICRGCSA